MDLILQRASREWRHNTKRRRSAIHFISSGLSFKKALPRGITPPNRCRPLVAVNCCNFALSRDSWRFLFPLRCDLDGESAVNPGNFAARLFYDEALVRINGLLSCTTIYGTCLPPLPSPPKNIAHERQFLQTSVARLINSKIKRTNRVNARAIQKKTQKKSKGADSNYCYKYRYDLCASTK